MIKDGTAADTMAHAAQIAQRWQLWRNKRLPPRRLLTRPET